VEQEIAKHQHGSGNVEEPPNRIRAPPTTELQFGRATCDVRIMNQIRDSNRESRLTRLTDTD